MLSGAERLTVEYLRRRPREAAHVIDHLPPADTAAVIARMPAAVAAPVINELYAGLSARILGGLAPDVAAPILTRLPSYHAAACLRGLTGERRNEVLGHMPTLVAKTLEVLIEYPVNTVGAWTESDILTLRGATTVSRARKRLGKSVEQLPSRLFIVDDDKHLVGAIGLAELLRTAYSGKLSEIAEPAPPALRSRATLATVRLHREWQTQEIMPVLNRRRELIGGLYRATLLKAVQAQDRSHDTPERDRGDLIELLLSGIRGVWLSGLTLLPGKRAQGEE